MAFKLGVQYDKPLALTVSHNSAKDQGNLLIIETFAILAKNVPPYHVFTIVKII